MKKLIYYLSAFFVLLFLSTTIIYAQDSGTPIPGDFDIKEIFTTFAGFCAGVLFITGLITRFIQMSAEWKSATSWIVAFILGTIGYLLNIGIFMGLDILDSLFIVVSFVLGANKVYETNFIRAVLTKLKISLPQKKK